MIIKEITFEELCLDAISFVSRPANDIAFLEFCIEKNINLDKETDTKAEEIAEQEALMRALIDAQNKLIKEKLDIKFYRYQNLDVKEFHGETRPFCKKHLNKIYDEYTIRNWVNMSASDKKKNGYIKSYADNFLFQFPNLGFKMDNVFYNCQHVLVEIPQHEVPANRRSYLLRNRPTKPPISMKKQEPINLSNEVHKFKMFNDKDQIITGVVLIPNQMVYRKNADIAKDKEGYIYFKKDTIKKLKENFNNKYFTYDHRLMLNSVEILDSYISEKSELNGVKIIDGSWVIKCKINNKDEYDRIKNLGDKSGFSIEGYVIHK